MTLRTYVMMAVLVSLVTRAATSYVLDLPANWTSPGNVSALLSEEATLNWKILLPMNDIFWCYWEYKDCNTDDCSPDQFLGYENRKRERLNIGSRQEGWEFTNHTSPCNGGIKRDKMDREHNGFYELNIVNNAEDEYESGNFQLQSYIEDELNMIFTVNDNTTKMSLKDGKTDSIVLDPIQGNKDTKYMISLALAETFPPNTKVTMEKKSSEGGEFSHSCLGSCAVTMILGSEKDVEVTAKIDSGIQGYSEVKVIQAFDYDGTATVVPPPASSNGAAVAFAVIFALLFFALLAAFVWLWGWPWWKNKKKKKGSKNIQDEEQGLVEVRSLNNMRERAETAEAAKAQLEEDKRTFQAEKMRLEEDKRALEQKIKKLEQEKSAADKAKDKAMKVVSTRLEEKDEELQKENKKVCDKSNEISKLEKQAEKDRAEIKRLKTLVDEGEQDYIPAKPAFVSIPAITDINKSLKTITMTANITGMGKPDVRWFRDPVVGSDKLRHDGQKVKITVSGNLYTLWMKEPEPGRYRVEATNIEGTAANRFRIEKDIWNRTETNANPVIVMDTTSVGQDDKNVQHPTGEKPQGDVGKLSNNQHDQAPVATSGAGGAQEKPNALEPPNNASKEEPKKFQFVEAPPSIIHPTAKDHVTVKAVITGDPRPDVNWFKKEKKDKFKLLKNDDHYKMTVEGDTYTLWMKEAKDREFYVEASRDGVSEKRNFEIRSDKTTGRKPSVSGSSKGKSKQARAPNDSTDHVDIGQNDASPSAIEVKPARDERKSGEIKISTDHFKA